MNLSRDWMNNLPGKQSELMQIMILSLTADQNEILSSHLQKLEFAAETVDYKNPSLLQIKEADVLVNGLGKAPSLLFRLSKRMVFLLLTS